ncbi:hypothetical protein [Burkholderia sp. IMCC1007]|uniref:hypothetical protein n=1 Tax=Burkholderia sp. IMCC1007 TaxID=3004104 RepID=UPI0022B32105|nr:hypothetical protein [Burkholderia sp. IMCC1007]
MSARVVDTDEDGARRARFNRRAREGRSRIAGAVQMEGEAKKRSATRVAVRALGSLRDIA